MKHFVMLAVALIAGCATSAHADLGETMPQVEARYGTALETRNNAGSGVTTNLYIHDGLGISVKFLEGKSQSESYLKDHKEVITDAEISGLLKLNAMGSDWDSVYKTDGTQRWELKSKDATAVYSYTDHVFTVSTKEFLRAGSKLQVVPPPNK